MRTPSPGYIANFDSATAMLRATARFLRGEDFPALGLSPGMKPLAKAVNLLPRGGRDATFALGGWNEAISPRRLRQVSAERVARWAVSQYPRRRYPATMVGSGSGAVVHLAAALGVPWLPQTFLIPVSETGVDPDEPKQAMEMGREQAWRLLEANPELQLHHMHDANQDRLMLQYMTYFRVKRRWLGAAYEGFLKDTLSPGGTIFLVECQRSWPVTRIGERHVFQHGALGGASEEEFIRGSERVERYLERYDSHRRRWDSPEPTEEAPEAEWGFAPELREDVERLARDNRFRVVRMVFDEPEHPSPLVADLYRWWYRRRRMPGNRLLVESFIVMEPMWALRTGSAPFWMKFNMEPSAEWLERYLDETEPYDDIGLMLFSHGVDAVGFAPIERWRALLGRARREGRFIGVDENAFPADFATFARYHEDVRRIPARYPVPGPLTLRQLEAFLDESGHRYPVEWVEHVAPAGGARVDRLADAHARAAL